MMCAFEGCERKTKARGLCRAHHQQLLRGQELRPLRLRMPPRVCSVSDCEVMARALGLCNKHYQQQRSDKLPPLISAMAPAGRWPLIIAEIDRSYLPLDVVLRDMDSSPSALKEAASRHGRPDLARRARLLIGRGDC